MIHHEEHLKKLTKLDLKRQSYGQVYVFIVMHITVLKDL